MLGFLPPEWTIFPSKRWCARGVFAAAALNLGNHENHAFSPAYDTQKAVLEALFHRLALYLNGHLGALWTKPKYGIAMPRPDFKLIERRLKAVLATTAKQAEVIKRIAFQLGLRVLEL